MEEFHWGTSNATNTSNVGSRVKKIRTLSSMVVEIIIDQVILLQPDYQRCEAKQVCVVVIPSNEM